MHMGTHTNTHMHAYNLPLSPSHAHTVNTCILLVLAGGGASRSWCRQSSLRYMYTRYHTQQRAELDRVPFYFMNFSPTVTSNMCRGT